jgi:hypothetical protein
LLNDPQFVEAARAFAERILHRQGTDHERLEWAFRETLARAPRADELAVLQRALARERAAFAAEPAIALQLLSMGESRRDRQLPPQEHAAWAQVASLLLNLSETVTRQ